MISYFHYHAVTVKLIEHIQFNQPRFTNTHNIDESVSRYAAESVFYWRCPSSSEYVNSANRLHQKNSVIQLLFFLPKPSSDHIWSLTHALRCHIQLRTDYGYWQMTSSCALKTGSNHIFQLLPSQTFETLKNALWLVSSNCFLKEEQPAYERKTLQKLERHHICTMKLRCLMIACQNVWIAPVWYPFNISRWLLPECTI